MPKGLKRYYGRGELHFLTFSCYRRPPLLGTARARNVFVQERGLVKHPKDWPWSSFSHYASGQPGLVEIDAVNI